MIAIRHPADRPNSVSSMDSSCSATGKSLSGSDESGSDESRCDKSGSQFDRTGSRSSQQAARNERVDSFHPGLVIGAALVGGILLGVVLKRGRP